MAAMPMLAGVGLMMVCCSSSSAMMMMGGEEKEDPDPGSGDSGADDSGADDSGATTPAATTPAATTPAATTPPPPAPEMLPNGVYTLRGGRGAKLCADEGGKVICDRDAVGSWEKFTITPL